MQGAFSFEKPSDKVKLSDKLELSKPKKKEAPLFFVEIHEPVRIEKRLSKVSGEDIPMFEIEEVRLKLFPNHPPTSLKELRKGKGKNVLKTTYPNLKEWGKEKF